jgi:pimeloyl-ACP methyl ester carboxylesterase
MTVYRVQSHNGDIYNPATPRREVMGLLAKQIEQYSSPPRVSIQLPAHHQSTPFALGSRDPNTLVIDFRWLGFKTGLRTLSNIEAPYEKAGYEADGLAQLINGLRAIAPECPVDVVAHRFGARVALMAIQQTRSKMWRNLLLSNAFEFSAHTLTALDCPMGAHLKCHNIISKGSSITPYLFDKFGPKPGSKDRAICYGYKFPHSNWQEMLEHTDKAVDLMHKMGANTIDFMPPKRSLLSQTLQKYFTKTPQIG